MKDFKAHEERLMPLNYAAQSGSANIISNLITYGVDTNAKDIYLARRIFAGRQSNTNFTWRQS